MNEIIRESPDQIALKMSQMQKLIKEQEIQIATRDHQLKVAEDTAK